MVHVGPLADLREIARIARRAMKRETVTAILLGLMAALPFGLLQHNWILAICFGVLVGVGMAPPARRIDRD